MLKLDEFDWYEFWWYQTNRGYSRKSVNTGYTTRHIDIWTTKVFNEENAYNRKQKQKKDLMRK